MDDLPVFEVHPPRPEDYQFNTDQWADAMKINQFSITIDRHRYKPFAKTKIVRISDQEITAIMHNMPTLLKNLRKKVDGVLSRDPMFFKLSTRSPKDAWRELLPDVGINPSDSYEVKKTKIEQQTSLLLVSSFDDVLTLLHSSERARDDLRAYFEENTLCPTFVFQEWRPSTSVEYRCFVKDRKMIAICGFPIDVHVDPLIKHKIKRVVEAIAKRTPMPSCVMDVFVDDLTPENVYVIELNPFSDITDPGPFRWEDLLA